MKKKLLEKRIKILEMGELQDLKILLSLSKKIKENESVINSLMENINLILDHLKLEIDFTAEQKARKILKKKCYKKGLKN